MKAVVIFQKGGIPQYVENFPEPKITSENEVLMTVKASAIKNFDKSQVGGTHYSSQQNISTAKVIGNDGAGILEDGTRVYALGNGMMAEKAVVKKNYLIKIPDGLDDATAAALPNAVAGSAMALRFRAQMKGGETLLINGATGFTGKIAVQIAKFYGAKKIIATGRNLQSLQKLLKLGADEIVSTDQADQDFISQLKQTHNITPFDIVIDYLWGHSAELILELLKGTGDFTSATKFISIGSVTGNTLLLSSDILRSADIRIYGSGIGSWTREQMKELFTKIVPEIFNLAAEKKITVETENIDIENIASLWNIKTSAGKRQVIAI